MTDNSLLLLLLTYFMHVSVSSFRGLPSKYDDYALYTILLKVLTTVLRSLENVRGLGILCYPLISGKCLFLTYNICLLDLLSLIFSTVLLLSCSTPPVWTGIRHQPPIPSSRAHPRSTDHHGGPSLLARYI